MLPTILLVDDNEDILEFLERILKLNGSTMIYTGMLSLLNGNQHRITFKSSQT